MDTFIPLVWLYALYIKREIEREKRERERERDTE